MAAGVDGPKGAKASTNDLGVRTSSRSVLDIFGELIITDQNCSPSLLDKHRQQQSVTMLVRRERFDGEEKIMMPMAESRCCFGGRRRTSDRSDGSADAEESVHPSIVHHDVIGVKHSDWPREKVNVFIPEDI